MLDYVRWNLFSAILLLTGGSNISRFHIFSTMKTKHSALHFTVGGILNWDTHKYEVNMVVCFLYSVCFLTDRCRYTASMR